MTDIIEEKRQRIIRLNRIFLMNASQVLQYEWKTCIHNLIEKMSMDFSSRYFPGFIFPDLILKGDEPKEELRLVGSYEKDCTFLLFLRCMFELKNPSFKKNILPFIQSIDSSEKFEDRFWIYNLASSQPLSIKEIEKILTKSEITLYTLPNLIFDPQYRKFMETDVYQYFCCKDLSDKSSPYYIPGDRSEGNKILTKFHNETDLNKQREFHQHFQSIELNVEVKEWFSHPQFFEDFFQGLGDYYIERIPSEAKYIRISFECFKELFKLLDGRVNYDLSFNKLKTQLQTTLSKERVDWFLNRFIISKQYQTFSITEYETPPCSLLRDYQDFIKGCGYIHFGRVYTGVMLVWKSVFKYVEELARKPVFRRLKGQLMENCVIDLAEAVGFSAYKVILKDTLQESSERYDLMKAQIDSFPHDKIIELEVAFPKYSPMTFMEFDVVIQIESQIMFCEVKSTAVEVGIQEDIIRWNQNIKGQFELMRLKGRLFENLFMAEKLNHEIFPEELFAKRYIIKSEGIAGIKGVLTLENLDTQLNMFREWIENETFDERWKLMKNGPYWQNKTKKDKSKGNLF